jgi:hypothetical protein
METVTTSSPSQIVDYATDPRLSREVREFLGMLNGSGAPPLETLSAEEARKVLSVAQASVRVDLSGIEVSERVIQADGYTVKLHIVRPEGEQGLLPVFMFIHGGGVGTWRLSNTSENGKRPGRFIWGSGGIRKLYTHS